MILKKKIKKLSTTFEPTNDVHVVNKAYLDKKLLEINGQLPLLEKDYNEFKLEYNKQSEEEILLRRVVKTTIQILYDKNLFDNYAKAEEVLKDFLFNTRRRTDLSEQVNDDIQWFCS